MADGMILAKRMGRNGKLHWLPGRLAYTTICGLTDPRGDWMPVRESSTVFWGECKRCKAIRDKAKAKAVTA